MEICQNCQKQIETQKYPTHLGYCRRNIIRCLTCQRTYDQNMQQQHNYQFHQLTSCPNCQINISMSQYQQHMNQCSKKPIICQYCQLKVPSIYFYQHQRQCQSRSTRCQHCRKYLQLKEYASHIANCQVSNSIKAYSENLYNNVYQYENSSQKARIDESMSSFSESNTNTYSFSGSQSASEGNNSSYQSSFYTTYVNSSTKSQFLHRSNQKDYSLNNTLDQQVQAAIIASMSNMNYINQQKENCYDRTPYHFKKKHI